MAEQATEQLVIEAVLKDLVSAQAGKIVQALKQANKEIDTASSTGAAAGKGPEAISQGLTKMLPIARKAGGELLNMSGQLGKFGGVVTGSLREASALLGEMGTAAGATGGTLLALGTAAAGVAALGTVFAIAANKSLALDKSIDILRVSADLTKDELGAFTQQAKDLAAATGTGTEENAQVIAAAFLALTKNAKEAAAATESVVKAAKVSIGGDQPVALMQALGDAVKAYGKSASDTDSVLGLLFATQRQVNRSMPDVAAGLAALAPYATTAKVSIEQVAATLAATSERAGGFDKAVTALRPVLVGLSNPTGQLGAAMRKLGVDTAVGTDGQRDLNKILQQTYALARDDDEVIGLLTAGVAKGRAIFAAAADGGNAYADALRAIRLGSFDLAQKQVELARTQSATISRVASQIGNTFTSIGEPIADAVKGLTSSLDSAKESLGGLSQEISSDAARALLAGQWDTAAKAVARYVEAERVATHFNDPGVTIESVTGLKFSEALEPGAKSSERILALLNSMKGATAQVGDHMERFDGIAVDAAEHVQILQSKVESVTEAAAKLDMTSPLARQIQELSARIGPLMLKTELDPATEKTVIQDLAILQDELNHGARMQLGQLSPVGEESRARIAQLTQVIERSQALSADLSIRAAAGYERQRLELEGAARAVSAMVAGFTLFGVNGAGLKAKAFNALSEMARAVGSKNELDRLGLQDRLLQAQRQSLNAELELAKARMDTSRAAEVTAQIDALDGRIIEENATRARAANVEQYRGRADLLGLAQQAADAAKEESEIQRETARLMAERARAQTVLQLAMRSGAERMDEILNQRALDLAKSGVMDLHDAVLAVRTDAAGIGEGFRQGMDDVLREYANSAQRMFEVSQSVMRSIHDEGTNALSGFAKGDLSGRNALRQFGKGVLGNAIDQSSSLLMDQLMGGIFGTGHGGDKNVTMRAGHVTVVASGPIDGAGAFFGPGGVFGGGAPGAPGPGSLFQGPVVDATVQAGQDIRSAGEQAGSNVQSAGTDLMGALSGLAGGIGGIAGSIMGLMQDLFSGGGGAGAVSSTAGMIFLARGGVVPGGLISEAHSYSGGGYALNPQMAVIGDNPGRAEAIVPLPGPNRGIPVEFRGGPRGGGGVTINDHKSLTMHLTVHSVDPRGAAEVVLSQMPQIQRAITAALVRGSDRALRDAVQGAAR